MARKASEKVDNYDVSSVLGCIYLTEESIQLNFTSELPTSADFDLLVSTIAEKIDSGVKPAGVLKKELGRIVLHKAQLVDAVQNLLAVYTRMSTPQKRMSAAQKARVEMLQAMSDDMLKKFAAIYLPDEVLEYILPAEKSALIDRLCEYLAEKNDTVATE